LQNDLNCVFYSKEVLI